MSRPCSVLLCALAVTLLSGCPQQEAPGPARVDAYKVAGVAEEFEDGYPKTITPPLGTEFPCRFEPLPEGLDGLPGQDHRYEGHWPMHLREGIFLHLRATDL